MYKFLIKLTFLSLVLLGVASFWGSDKVLADSPLCPNISRSGSGQVPAGYGYNQGEQLNGFGGLVVSSSVGRMTNGQPDSKGRTGNPINASYQLNSYVPDAPAGYRYNLGGNPQSDRIFKVDSSNNPIGRMNQRWFGTNGSTGDALYSGNNQFTCPGWDALGPGQANPSQIGNRFALDCGEAYYRPGDPNTVQGRSATRFWISDLPAPNGESGRWKVEVFGANAQYSFNFSSGSMGPSDQQKYFTITNGATIRINLVWEADPPPPPPTGDCTAMTIRDDGGHNNNRTYTRVTIRGTNNDQTNYHIGHGGQHTFGYRAIAPTITVQRVRWENRGTSQNPNWQIYSDTVQRIDCYRASCAITNIIGDPSVGNTVLVGRQFTAIVRVTNDNPSPDRQTIPASVGGYNFSLTGMGGPHYVGADLGPGQSSYLAITLVAPPSVQNYGISFYPDFWGYGALGPACGANVPVYQQFSASGTAQSSLEPTDENPDMVNYNTVVTVSGTDRPVYIPTTSCLYKQPPSSSCGGALDSTSGGNYPPGQTRWDRTRAPDTLLAGDQYCAFISLGYTSGYIGPGGPTDIRFASGPIERSSCDKVTNKPYFKVYGTGASAGTAIRKSDGSCSASNGGLLAGWNSNAGGQQRGAGSQLSALALVKITGFASAQAAFNVNTGTDAAKLTFANNGAGVDKTVDTEDPALGGNFSASGYCVDNVSPPTSGGNTTTLPGGSSYGGAAGITDSRSVFVNGDVTITGNVTYGATASADNAPSFVLKASGNIYIAPGVTRLDGVFMSEKKIYTCATSAGPVTANAYNTCKNQLLVRGSFVADQIKLARTFGSLRDEEPVVGSMPGPPTNTSVAFNRYYCGSGNPPGSVAFPSIHFYQTQSNPRQPANVPGSCYLEGTIGYALPTQTNGSVPLYYVNGSNGKDWFYTTSYGEAQYDGGRPCAGRSACVPGVAGYVFNTPVAGTIPLYGVYGLASQTHFYTTNLAEYQAVASSPGIMGLGPVAYLYASPGQGGSPTTIPTPLAPPNPLPCSNRGTQVVNTTCAAEVFEFSPELFLSKPAIQPPNDGAPQWDAVTSLPPVL